MVEKVNGTKIEGGLQGVTVWWGVNYKAHIEYSGNITVMEQWTIHVTKLTNFWLGELYG